MSPPTDVSGVRSSRDATIDAIVEALSLQVQAMLVERKAVERVLGCDADETVLDAAVRVAGDLANTEKQIDDVRDILKAKLGELTVDAATRAVVLAQQHAPLVKQVEQLVRLLKEQAEERDAYRVRVKDLEADVCKLPAERNEARRERDQVLAELNAVRRILSPLNDRETTIEAAKRMAERRDEARAAAGRMMKDLDDVRTVLEAKAGETTVDAARRVVAAAHSVVDAAREVERTAKVVSQTQEAISALEQKVNEKETAAILAALGARSGEKAIDAATRVVKERDDLRDAFQTVSHCQQMTARSFLGLAETLGVSPSDAASRVDSIIAREKEFRFAVAAYAQQDEELREILLAGPTERTLEAVRRMAKAYEDTRKESFRLRNDLENIRKMTKAANGETANAAVWRILGTDVALQRDQARMELEEVRRLLSPNGSWESTADATARVIKERIEAIRERDRALAALADTSSAVATRIREALGAKSDERTEDAAKRVVAERDQARDELALCMSL